MSQDVKPKSSSSFHFLAGLTTGTLSALLLQPADLLKTRLQQSRTTTLLPTLRLILTSPHPIAHLWRGTLPSVIRTGLGSALYFSSLNALRQHLAFSPLLPSTALITPQNANNPPKARQYSSSTLPHLSNTANLATGAIARASAGLALTPITVLKVRYESNLYAYSSLWSAIRAIWIREGAKGFFAGWGATAVRDAPYAGLYVVFYEQGKRRLSSLQGGDMGQGRSVGINFTSGVVAAGLATAITNPFDAVKTRLQLMPGKYGNMFQAAAKMVKDDGVRSLFDGLGLRMARKAASSALAWTLYEELVKSAEGKWEEAAAV